MKANIKTVASKAGVSTATVSRVLAGFEGVKDATREKVLGAIKELDYEVDSVARSLRQRKTDTIGIVVGNVLSAFYSIIAKSIEETSRESGYKVILCNGDDDPEKELEYLKVLRSNKVDGIILTPTGKNREYIKSIIRSGIKVILLDRLVDGLDADAVLVDNFKGSYTATKFLIDQGYKNIGLVTGYTDRTTGRKRLEGYLSALKDAGIKVNDSLVKIGDFKKESGIRLCRELLEGEISPDSIFSANTDMTLGCLLTLKEEGLKIPDDIGFIGFDDPEWSTIIEPPLTAVSQPVYELGKTAAELLIEKINSGRTILGTKPSIITLNTGFIVRSSTRKMN